MEAETICCASLGFYCVFILNMWCILPRSPNKHATEDFFYAFYQLHSYYAVHNI